MTACAYCKQMLDDSVKQKDLEETIEVVDIASLVLRSLPPLERTDADGEAEGDAPEERRSADAS